MSEKYYILTPEQAKTYEKEALKYSIACSSLCRKYAGMAGPGLMMIYVA